MTLTSPDAITPDAVRPGPGADEPARRGWRATMPTHSATSGPNSGPTTIAPTIKIGWSTRTPMLAINMATTMKVR